MSFTLAQARAWAEAAAREDRRRLADRAVAMRMAFGADRNAWKTFIAALES